MSNILILVDRNNADRNEVREIAAAVESAGGDVFEVNEERYLIEAAVPAQDVATVSAMEGVAYVRVVFSYFRPEVLAAA